MVLIRAALVHAGNHTYFPVISKCLHTTALNNLDQRWRMNKGLPQNPNSHGQLTDKADYTFRDGRPTPLGTKQLFRMKRQSEFAARIIQLVGEVDNAVERHKRLQKEEEERKSQILNSKLKPKGQVTIE